MSDKLREALEKLSVVYDDARNEFVSSTPDGSARDAEVRRYLLAFTDLYEAVLADSATQDGGGVLDARIVERGVEPGTHGGASTDREARPLNTVGIRFYHNGTEFFPFGVLGIGDGDFVSRGSPEVQLHVRSAPPSTSLGEPTDEMVEALGTIKAMAAKHSHQWLDRADDYWLCRLTQEVGELASVIAEDHSDTVERELAQIGSIAVNWLRLRAALAVHQKGEE